MSRPPLASILAPAFALAVAFAPIVPASAGPPTTEAPALPEIEGIGSHHRAVTTSSKEAQRLFDEGLLLTFAFNHQEAVRRFEAAAEADPACAMAYWGKALALGPNINHIDMDEAATTAAVEALAEAKTHAARCTPVEKALLAALEKRYVLPMPAARTPLDTAYAEAMRGVHEAHPEDVDVGALFAESLLDLSPWNQWSKSGEALPGTEEIVATLESVLAKAPNHALAIHLYIHAVEASPNPERALPAADRLRDLVPGAGHLVHMPGHIDLRLGRYAEAIEANRKGVAADLKYVAQAGREGFYTVYRAHNFHFLTYAAMFDGQSKTAMEAARSLVREVPLEVVRTIPDALDGFIATPYHVMVRFGRWQEILDEPMPPAELKVTTTFAHYARTVAFSATGRVAEAEKELAAFEKAYGEIPETSVIGNNASKVVLDIARLMAQGELEYRRGNHDQAFALLRDAVVKDEALHYDEPWGWFQPVSHALGALLLEQGKTADAEAVYRRDLELHPGNGWALTGLAECLRKSGRAAEAAKVEEQLAKSWARADVKPAVSCFCRKS